MRIRHSRNFLLGILLLLSLCPAWALDLDIAGEDGGGAGAFLDDFASARSLAMGRAYTGVADDSSAIYWNPAGLTQLQRKDLLAMYSTLPEDAGFGFVSLGLPTARTGTFGVGVMSLQSGDFTRRDDSGNDTGSFSNNTGAALFS